MKLLVGMGLESVLVYLVGVEVIVDDVKARYWPTSDKPAPGSTLLVHAEYNCLRGRGDVEASNIGGFDRKVRVVALAPRLASRKVNLVAAQEPPDILDVNIAQRLGQQRAGPAHKSLRGRLIQQLSVAIV